MKVPCVHRSQGRSSDGCLQSSCALSRRGCMHLVHPVHVREPMVCAGMDKDAAHLGAQRRWHMVGRPLRRRRWAGAWSLPCLTAQRAMPCLACRPHCTLEWGLHCSADLPAANKEVSTGVQAHSAQPQCMCMPHARRACPCSKSLHVPCSGMSGSGKVRLTACKPTSVSWTPAEH